MKEEFNKVSKWKYIRKKNEEKPKKSKQTRYSQNFKRRRREANGERKTPSNNESYFAKKV